MCYLIKLYFFKFWSSISLKLSRDNRGWWKFIMIIVSLAHHHFRPCFKLVNFSKFDLVSKFSARGEHRIKWWYNLVIKINLFSTMTERKFWNLNYQKILASKWVKLWNLDFKSNLLFERLVFKIPICHGGIEYVKFTLVENQFMKLYSGGENLDTKSKVLRLPKTFRTR